VDSAAVKANSRWLDTATSDALAALGIHPTIFLGFKFRGWNLIVLVHMDMFVRCGHPGEKLGRAGESSSVEQILEVAESMV
jgi:hypothetical protein